MCVCVSVCGCVYLREQSPRVTRGTAKWRRCACIYAAWVVVHVRVAASPMWDEVGSATIPLAELPSPTGIQSTYATHAHTRAHLHLQRHVALGGAQKLRLRLCGACAALWNGRLRLAQPVLRPPVLRAPVRCVVIQHGTRHAIAQLLRRLPRREEDWTRRRAQVWRAGALRLPGGWQPGREPCRRPRPWRRPRRRRPRGRRPRGRRAAWRAVRHEPRPWTIGHRDAAVPEVRGHREARG